MDTNKILNIYFIQYFSSGLHCHPRPRLLTDMISLYVFFPLSFFQAEAIIIICNLTFGFSILSSLISNFILAMEEITFKVKFKTLNNRNFCKQIYYLNVTAFTLPQKITLLGQYRNHFLNVSYPSWCLNLINIHKRNCFSSKYYKHSVE